MTAFDFPPIKIYENYKTEKHHKHAKDKTGGPRQGHGQVHVVHAVHAVRPPLGSRLELSSRLVGAAGLVVAPGLVVAGAVGSGLVGVEPAVGGIGVGIGAAGAAGVGGALRLPEWQRAACRTV